MPSFLYFQRSNEVPCSYSLEPTLHPFASSYPIIYLYSASFPHGLWHCSGWGHQGPLNCQIQWPRCSPQFAQPVGTGWLMITPSSAKPWNPHAQPWWVGAGCLLGGSPTRLLCLPLPALIILQVSPSPRSWACPLFQLLPLPPPTLGGLSNGFSSPQSGKLRKKEDSLPKAGHLLCDLE